MSTSFPDWNELRLGIIGLGYVGLPLAVEFGKRFPTLGYDLKPDRIAELRAGRDSTGETTREDLRAARHLRYTGDPVDLADCNVYLVTVPTPIDRYKRPDLGPIEKASATVGRLLRPGNLVVYESTVYPGATEEVCVPILERESGLTFNRDFYVGYSPERINPGDREHRLTTIKKVTAGSTPEALDFVDTLYRSIIEAGTHRAPSIRVAEAAKVIENTQRDVNIALVNELAILFHRLGIDTGEVLAAAGSKWNFLPFRPGLVGGHCIGVDPYYLTHKAQEIGHHPEIILAGRRINDQMGHYVAGRLLRLLSERGIPIPGARVLILGLAFKENCPDLRNTRVVDIIEELRSHRCQVDVHDPRVSAAEARAEYGLELIAEPRPGAYHALLLAVAHDEFRRLSAADLRAWGRPGVVVFDVKHVLPAGEVDGRL
ncbi:MAG TPA: Vi polysaccharide biosynthesis UDP-N-acetylglucosamine C-6 dehydrogenase TviB [Methylococcus sp.]|nr:Vi polysaccharide biosynthesis UDP-N-acetylglucosamine C-6 dehydrogenase TviB [Methylococcus sp.]